ncbi:uracil-DNA glycosylase family protein [Pseudoruegeria sp. SK021]|uniref:uracil-DNA glycosylase family protein n=1 Tax=Pseudoruegeria sp. SK021 TaxID=1933035 RepID=UPI000A232742|nr:uracil-DNA glycosylase family protein [Pseudoruegeria sp. SK021]OSP53893.1 uracil-DNA glycosylase [Pseudoruegeria sp. SK021]
MPTPPPASPSLGAEIAACRLCAERFAATASAHQPRPVVWFRPTARLLIAGQAPGMRVHGAGIPFHDRSGDRLRDWLGLTEAEFYDRDRVAIVPMAFCFPGYDAKSSDLPPPPICAHTWHARVMAELPDLQLILPIGGPAQRWHLGPAARGGVTATVTAWRSFLPRALPLPHPSWRNTAWLTRNPWFATELVPVLRQHVRRSLETR